MRSGRRRFFKAVSLLLVGWLCGSSPAQAEMPDSKLEFHRNDTQQHFWLWTGGTTAGAGLFQAAGMEKRPALALSVLGMVGAGFAKEYLIDAKPSGNDLMADGLGILLGSVLTLTIRFDPHFGFDPTLGAPPPPVAEK